MGSSAAPRCPSQGRASTITQGPRTTTFGYDGAGWFGSVSDALGQTTVIARDGVGRAVMTTRPDGNTVAQGYDQNGNLAALTPPGKPAHMLSYDD